jgi:hypothetical protein
MKILLCIDYGAFMERFTLNPADVYMVGMPGLIAFLVFKTLSQPFKYFL